jgi:3-methyladenine DNA glycosylase AlkC
MKLKDLFNQQSVAALAEAFQRVYAAFDRQAFTARVFDSEWEARELKERMRHITIVMHDYLPRDYRGALRVLHQALPLVEEQGFAKMVFPDYVELYGLDDWEASIAALETFTQHISAEFAIRPFIVRQQTRTMAQMLAWAKHHSPEVRRLASEGCRPRLPWGIRLPALQADPSPILPVLAQLRHDESEAVRRSVANNLNDISKDHPQVVLDLLQRWRGEDVDAGREESRWITRHALRTLLKKGNPDALELLGYSSQPAVTVRNVAVTPNSVEMGGEVTLSFEIVSLSREPQKLMIDYVVHHVRARGQRTPMVFKLTKRNLKPGEALLITKRHSFAPVTTRRYYPGEHAIEPKINGQLFGQAVFVVGPSIQDTPVSG